MMPFREWSDPLVHRENRKILGFQEWDMRLRLQWITV